MVVPFFRTNYSGKTATIIDYFVVSDLIVNYSKVECVAVVPAKGASQIIPKHVPVRLTLKGTGKTRMVKLAEVPRSRDEVRRSSHGHLSSSTTLWTRKS